MPSLLSVLCFGVEVQVLLQSPSGIARQVVVHFLPDACIQISPHVDSRHGPQLVREHSERSCWYVSLIAQVGVSVGACVQQRGICIED
eukprot:scaffold71594_cov69-Phaeocystis_antarctica.AAC.3